MKSILISIKPKWVAKILNGEKTIEIRKTMPKCDLPIDVYIYCTKEDTLSILTINCKDTFTIGKDFILNDFGYLNSGYEGKGKVVAKFTLNKVDRYVNGCNVAKKYPTFNDFEKILTPACLYTDELENYCEDLSFYAWHISNLKIFDKPKELNEFYPYCKDEKCEYRKNHCSICYRIPLTKAPQNMVYIETEN